MRGVWQTRWSEATTVAGVEGEETLRLPGFLQRVASLKLVKLGYHYLITHFFALCLVPLMAALTLIHASQSQLHYADIHELYLRHNLVTIVVFLTVIVSGSTVYFMTRPASVYLVDYACYLPPPHLKVSSLRFVEQLRLSGLFDDASVDFHRKILNRSGLGDETYGSEAILSVPPRLSMAAAREEAEQFVFGALDKLFNTTSLKPSEIGILVVNYSLFSPTPSLSAMVVNRYKLRSDIKSFNLSGMGCSAGVIAIDLAKDLLKVNRNTCAVVVSTENVTVGRHFGRTKSMMVANCLFRVGGSAILLSNKPGDRGRAKYRLVHVVRTHL